MVDFPQPCVPDNEYIIVYKKREVNEIVKIEAFHKQVIAIKNNFYKKDYRMYDLTNYASVYNFVELFNNPIQLSFQTLGFSKNT